MEEGGKVVDPNPKPNKGVISWILDVIEKVVIYFLYHKPEKNHYLSGNFAPVREETAPCSGLPVKGFLPECLNGEFVKVGPNSKFNPVAGYHWFDGDGMIHGLHIKDGKTTYVSRYVRTSRLKQEEFFSGSKFLKIADLKGWFGILMASLYSIRVKFKVLDLSYGDGTANTALVYHNGKLLALQEADKPYVVQVLEDGDLQTLGMLDYDKRLNHPFTAHPKIDPVTDELFTFGCSMLQQPFLTYRVVNKDGSMLDPVPITIPEPVMMHDFAITENYAIFMDLPMVIREKNMRNGQFLVLFDDTKKARFGVLPKYAKDELPIRWFELPACFIFHVANAWEEEDDVVLVCCRSPRMDLDMLGEAREMFEPSIELFEMRFNMENGAASQRQLSVQTVEFPRINDRYVGRKQQYVYASIFQKMQIVGVAKFDLLAEPADGKTKLEVGGNIKGIFELGSGRYGSEAIFVPRQQGHVEEEDDGYLIFFVYDENVGKSEVVVIDAKTMATDPVAVVELPVRVPHGFHSLFVPEEKLKNQV